MPFSINKEGRPQGTELIEEGVVHYTCNSPGYETLKKHDIKSIGRAFGVEPREVLLIPVQLMEGIGRSPEDTISVENMLRNLRE